MKPIYICVVFLIVFCLPTLGRAQNVTLRDNGSTVTLANGLVAVVVQKSDGKATSITSNSLPTLNFVDPSYGLFFRTLGGSGTTSVGLFLTDGPGATYSVVTNTSQMVDIMIRNPEVGYNATNYPNGLWDLAIHYVLRAGDSGFYNYWVWRHNASQPAAYFTEDEMPARLNIDQFSYTAWDFSGLQKTGRSYPFSGTTATTFPPPGNTNILPELQKLPLSSSWTQPTGQTDANGLPLFTQPTGLTSDHYPTWTKYDWNPYMGPSNSYLNAWGVANDQAGIWHLTGSMEWTNGGPTKDKGAVSGNYLYMNGADTHGYGNGIDNPGVAAGEIYTKICGPFFTYVNTGSDHLTLWQNAQNRAQQEVANWPYSWVNESETDYPRHRGAVTGTITASTGQSTANAIVILSPAPSAGWTGPDANWTGEGAWMWEGVTNFQFWTTADASGHFTIPKVRPGAYTLYSFTPGIFGEYKIANVTATAAQTTDLGVIAWDPPRRQQVLWQVGTPDHTTNEFRYGNLMKQMGLWWRYMEEMGTNDLNYTIGTSTPANDWYYAQCIVPVDGGTYYAPNWNINFNLTTVPSSALVLTVDLAGGYGTYFYTYVNGKNVTPAPNTSAGMPTTSGADVYRDSVLVGRWQHYEVTLPSSAFKVGANTLSMRVRQPGFSGTWTGTTKPEMLAGGLMYDALKLEAGPQVHTVTGVVAVPNWLGAPQPLTFTLTPTGATTSGPITQTLTPAADGSFILPGVPAGTYTLGIKGSRWLRRDVAVDTSTGAAAGLAVSLAAGDLNGDNQVSISDLATMLHALGSSPLSANWNPNADLNGDGVVNAADLALLRANYGKRGDP